MDELDPKSCFAECFRRYREIGENGPGVNWQQFTRDVEYRIDFELVVRRALGERSAWFLKGGCRNCALLDDSAKADAGLALRASAMLPGDYFA